MFLDLKLKIIHFYRRNKKKIYLVAIALGIVIAINTYLGYLQSIAPPTTNYSPHNPVIYGEEVTDKKTQSTIEEAIEKYIDYCNNKNYKDAFDCLTDDCKKYRFKNNIQNFKSYIDYIFDKTKVYSIQDLSNKEGVYIYKVAIMEDILATGMNNEDSDLIYDEYIVLTKNGDDFKFAVDGYVKNEKMNITYDDEYMEATITEKDTTYETVTYKVKVTNKTKNDIIFASKHDDKEFVLSLNGDYRIFKEDPYYEEEIVIYNGQTSEFSLTFNKYYDESRKETELIFNKIRVLKDYTRVDDRWEQEVKDTVKAYSVTFPLDE